MFTLLYCLGIYVISFFLSYVMLRLAHKYDEENMGKPSWYDILFITAPIVNSIVVCMLAMWYIMTAIFNVGESVYKHFTNPTHIENRQRTIYWLFGIEYEEPQKDNRKSAK